MTDVRLRDLPTDGLDLPHSRDVHAFEARLDTRAYSVILSRDPVGPVGRHRARALEVFGGVQNEDDLLDFRWHLSIAGTRAVPRWSDITAITHRLRPGVPFVIGVPPRSWWINVHEHCLHLWEIRDENL